jgi:DDE superfamily endonuclease
MGDSSVLVLHLVSPVEETMTHFAMCFQALSWPLGCSPAWMAAADEERKSQYLAGALNLATGEILHCRSARKTNALFRDLLTLLDHAYPAPRITRIYVVVDNYCIHQAKAVGQWIESHPRFTLLWLPTYCPRANPIERAFGDVHDQCTRNHRRKRLRDVVSDVERHLRQNGPWLYRLSQLYDAPAVTAAVERLAAAERVKVAA